VTDLLAQHHEMSFHPPQVGRAVLMLLKVAGDNRIRLPVELAMIGAAVEAKSFVQRLPSRVNRILDRLADNELKVHVDAIDEARLMEGMQKVANRIALGLVLAALIVGAALLMDVPTSFQIFGYPGLAMLLFLGAAAGGAALAVSILANDIKAKRKART
jgi:ubiquinone biosynthesis protein